MEETSSEHVAATAPALPGWLWLWLALAATTFVLWRLRSKRKRNPRGLPLPPGPKGVPIFGNMFQIASGKSWVAYRDWGKKYGDVVYLEVMGEPILALNSLQVCRDLLEQRAPNYSDRKLNTALDMIDIVRWDFGLFNYGPWWRANRRVFHQYFNHNEVQKYYPIIEDHTSIFLRRVAARPQAFCDNIKYLFGSIIMQVSYGVSDPKYTESLIDDAEAIIAGFGEVAVPGRFLVDVFPFLRHVPSWLPGAGWKRQLDALAATSRDVYQRTFDDAKERLRQGVQSEHPSVAGSLIDKMPPEDDPEFAVHEELARNAILVAYVAGADTTASSGQAVLLALAMYPSIQRTAQKELDAVVGHLRIPKLSDLDKLPYIRAIAKEVSRWHSVAPLALPHVVKEDDEYNGYFIPKGTIVFGNAWAIMHDPQIYEDPMEFKPERFMKNGELDPTVLDPDVAAFGFGRRICPGRHLSNESLPYMVACLLSVFNINPAKDAEGNNIPLVYDTGPDIVPKPSPFVCDIVPRSTEHLALVSEL